MTPQNSIAPTSENHDPTGIHTYAWEPLGISATMRWLRRDFRGWNGELTVHHKELGLVFQEQVGLLSASAKQDFVKALHSRMGQGLGKAELEEAKLNWYGIILAICTRTLESHRAQLVNPKRLYHFMATPQVKWCVAPYLLHNSINVFYGPPAAAKSYLALALAITVSTGDKSVLGVKPDCIHPVCYLDWEDGLDDHAIRLRRLLTPYTQVEANDILYQQMDSPITETVDQLRGYLTEHKVGLTIFDSSIYMAPGNPNEDETVALVKRCLAQLPGTKLLIAHNTKDGDKGIRGSLMWTGMARMVWELKAHAEAGQPEVHVALYNRKHNQVGRQYSQGYHVTFNDKADTTIFKWEKPGAIPELSGKLSAREQIDAVLTSPMTSEEIAEATGIPLATVKARMSDYKDKYFTVTNPTDKAFKWGRIYHDQTPKEAS